MKVSRALLRIGPTDTGGTYVDTGPPIRGALRQIFWHPNDPGDTGTAFDTGGDLRVDMIVGGSFDTGANLNVVNDNDCLGAAFSRAPMQARPRSDGFDTGAGSAFGAPFYGAGEQVRVTITPGGRRVEGNLWFYTEDN